MNSIDSADSLVNEIMLNSPYLDGREITTCDTPSVYVGRHGYDCQIKADKHLFVDGNRFGFGGSKFEAEAILEIGKGRIVLHLNPMSPVVISGETSLLMDKIEEFFHDCGFNLSAMPEMMECFCVTSQPSSDNFLSWVNDPLFLQDEHLTLNMIILTAIVENGEKQGLY